jgi:hypothetical protein
MTEPTTNANLRPGKGAHLDLTEETLDFLQSTFMDLWNAAATAEEVEKNDGDDRTPLDELIDSGEGMQYLKDVNNSATHWKKAKDKFGTKLYKALPWGEGGEIRVTVVLNSQGALKVDVRYWFDPEQSTSQWQGR